jgi:hypothetical protein
MRQDAETLVEQLRVLVQRVLDSYEEPALAGVEEKLETLERSIRDFERLSIPVPQELTEIRRSLSEDARRRRDLMDTLAYLESSLTDLQARVERAVPRPAAFTARTGRRTRRRQTTRGSWGEFSHTKPRGFVLDGRHYQADTWVGLLVELAQVLSERHADDFHRVLELRGTKHPNFSRDPSDLVAPRPIGETGIVLDAHRSASHIVRIAQSLAQLFGYGPDRFSIVEPNTA